MIKLDQKAEILMKYFRENISQRAVAREIKGEGNMLVNLFVIFLDITTIMK